MFMIRRIKNFFLVIAAISTTFINDTSRIPMLNGDNYSDCKETTLFLWVVWTLTWLSVLTNHPFPRNQAPQMRKLNMSGGSDPIA